MCGISIVFSGLSSKETLQEINENLLSSLGHRGPDGRGIWSGENISLGHTRLALLDLGDGGAQPMMSASGKTVIVFNGEIYNSRDLLNEIRSVRTSYIPRGSSDTEVLCEYLEIFGVSKAVRAINGMYAFGVYDILSSELTIATDLFGEKKLFYKFVNGFLYIHSEIGVLASVGSKSQIRTGFLTEYFDYGFSLGTKTCYDDISSFGQNQITKITLNGTKFTFAREQASLNLTEPQCVPDSQKTALEMLKNSVETQLNGDASGAIFLSGGVDSTTIAAIASRYLGVKLPAFSARFGIADFDEFDIAKTNADILGIEHHTVDVGLSHVSKFLSDIHDVCGQPFADSSIVSVLALSREVSSRGYKYVLTGDGGDEIFFGYNRYRAAFLIKRLDNAMRTLFGRRSPQYIRNYLAKLIRKIANNESYLSVERLRKLELLLTTSDQVNPCIFFPNLSKQLLSFKNNELPMDSVTELSPDHLRSWDLENYLPNDLLFKGDKGCMWNSVENRAPFLTQSILAVSNKLSIDHHLSLFDQKRHLKNILGGIFPEYVHKNKKMGFSAPLSLWVTNEMSARFFDRVSIARQGIFQPKSIERLKVAFEKDRNTNVTSLWSYICFQNWYERFNRCEL